MMDSKSLELALKFAFERHLKKPDGMTPEHLEQAMAYSLLSPGKRIRPRLLLTCADMLGLPNADVLPAALALEMIHCFTLIHDDLPCMDDDDFRRGLPSNHKKFGEALALLAGDALMVLATEVFFDSHFEPKNLVAGFKRFVWAAGPRGVMGGQAAESLLGKHSSLNDLIQMHAQKTGALFSAALLIPKEFAGISDGSAQGQSLSQFGYELGLAFQMADDLEDGTENGPQNIPQHEPTSVLFYLSPQEASDLTLEKLQRSTQKLKDAWGEKAQGLVLIAEEVGRKINTALANYAEKK